MKKYKVIAASVGGSGNKIFAHGDVVTEENFIPGRAEELVKSGFLTPLDDEEAPEEEIEEVKEEATEEAPAEEKAPEEETTEEASTETEEKKEEAPEDKPAEGPKEYDDITGGELKEILGDKAESADKKKDLYAKYVDTFS